MPDTRRSLPLSALLPALPGVQVVGPPLDGLAISGLAYDSRRVRPGDLFVALPGLHVDGMRFVPAAIDRGAVAVLCQQEPLQEQETHVPHLVVPDARAAMADAAAAYFGHPSDRLHLVGVTGTDGKTTTGFLLHALLQGTGRPAGLIGTVGFRVGDRAIENQLHQTTPESPDVQELLAAMVEADLEYAVLETSSHALMLDRVRGCRFDSAILTNITSDHLDFHGTLENYRAAKARLFAGLGGDPPRAVAPIAILNRDDASYDAMAAASAAPVLSYGRHPDADVRATDVVIGASGIRFRAVTPAGVVELHSPLTGDFNVSNLLAALGFAVARSIPLDAAGRALGSLGGVPGRMQRVEAGQPFAVVIDFAHTPDALAKALDTLRAVTPPPGRLIAVFGAPGERDRGKRPVMGRVAAERCDLVVLADDDPRGEDRHAIIEQIAAGARAAGLREGRTLLLRPDRRDAIATAIGAARPGDTVLLAGKGHEQSITSGDVVQVWDEESAARAAIAALKGEQ